MKMENKINDIIEIGYYLINGTKKMLYWDGEEWKKPIKDNNKRYGVWVSQLDKQPKIKSVKLINIETFWKI